MSKGGARARSGPAPDPNALRRERDAGEWVELPAAGREGPVPEWPLPRPSQRERTLWAAQWARPQAIMWERQQQQLEVALYVRAFAAAEKPGASVAARTLVRQLVDALGLSTVGLRAARWKIVTDPADGQPPRAGVRRSARDRLKVVDGGERSNPN